MPNEPASEICESFANCMNSLQDFECSGTQVLLFRNPENIAYEHFICNLAPPNEKHQSSVSAPMEYSVLWSGAKSTSFFNLRIESF